jgi:hypothetical protein
MKFGCTWLVLAASRQWWHCHAISHMYGLITFVIQARGLCNSPFIVTGFGYKMNERRKYASPSVMQVKKKRRKTISIEEKLDVIGQLEKGNELLTYAVMLDSRVLAYIQSVIMLIELRKGPSQEVKCFCSKTTTVLSEWSVPNMMDVSYIFTALLINTLYKNVYIVCRSVCPLVVCLSAASVV